MKGSVEIRAELVRGDAGKWGVTLTMPKSLSSSVLDEWHAKTLYVMSSGGPVDASTYEITLGVVPETACGEEWEVPDYLQVGFDETRLKCVRAKGHDGSHESKKGGAWGPMSSETVSDPSAGPLRPPLDAEAVRRIVSGRVFTDDTIGDETLRQSPRGFDTELQRHRVQVERMCPNQRSSGPARNLSPVELEQLVTAVWFLLAVAHQPVPGGVVEVGGSSPAHEYTGSALEAELATGELTALRELEQTIRGNNPTAGTMARVALNNLDALREKARTGVLP